MTSSEPSTVVRRVLQSLVDEGPEVGVQVAAYLDGNLVVDAWAGLGDEATGRLVDYDRPVSSCWPEFGYADPARRFAIGFAKNYFTYNAPTPGRRAGPIVAEAVIAALGI